MAKLNYDSVKRSYEGNQIEVRILEHEIAGYVNGTQIYGVYYDRPPLRVSMAKAPCGALVQSAAEIQCMAMVIDVACDMFPILNDCRIKGKG